MNTFIAGILFYIFPLILGMLFTNRLILAYIYGILATFVIFLIFWPISVMLPDSIHFLPLTILTLSLISLAINTRKIKLITLKPYQRFVPVLSLLPILIISSSVYFLIWKNSTPYPLVLNWDIYEHLTATNQIVGGNFKILPSQFSDTFTFNSYTSLFYTLLAVPTILLKIPTLGMYWWLEYFHYLIVIATSYFLAKAFFKNYWISTMSAFISAFAFESSIAYTSFFLLPQTLAGVLGALLVMEIYIKKTSWKKISLALFTIFLLHFIIGIVILMTVILWKLSDKILPGKIVLLGSLLAMAVSIVANFLGHWTLTTREEATHFNLSLTEKINLLLNWYGFFWILIGVAVVVAIIKKDHLLSKVISLTLLLLALSIAPFSYFLKFFVLTHFFLCLTISVGIYILIEKSQLFIKSLGTIGIITCFLAIFYINQNSFKEPFYFKGYYSELSFSEIETADWLNKNYGQQTLIISDPATQYILESLSGLNSQGGAYMNTQSRQILSSLNPLGPADKIKNQLNGIKDSTGPQPQHRLLVISGRYLQWQKFPQHQKLSTYYNVWRPYIISPSDYPYIDEFTAKFKVIYQNSEMVVLEI